MTPSRRTFLKFTGAAAAAPAFSPFARAQTYPSRPITMIVPFPGGGPADVVGRVIAERMRKALGQPIVIENVSGGSGTIGTGRAARAAPDGFTISLGGLGDVMNAAFYTLAYDVLNDFAPITPLVEYPYILYARRTMAAQNLGELIAWLKANPDKASAGVGATGPRLITALFGKETGTHFTFVPYRGTSPRVADLLAGQIDFSFGEPDQLSLARAGSIKVYAVTADARLAVAPDLPSFGESGLPALSLSNWYGLFAPKATSRDIINKLHAAAVEALADPGVRSRLVELGFGFFPRERQTSDGLTALQNADAAKWWPIIKELGIKAE